MSKKFNIREWREARKKAKEITIEQGTYYKFDLPKDPENAHYFLAEETLIPRINSCDTQRANMFSSHVSQLVHLIRPEYPKVFTNFENQFGEYSISYKKASKPFKIISKLNKNKLNYDLIIQYTKTGVYDVIHYRHGQHITEEYGYAVEDCLADKEVGDTVKEDEYLYKPSNYDEHGNFGYGVNLKSCYLPYLGLTYEDAVVLSESAAKKLTSYKCEETFITINNNDILLNLYENDEFTIYHALPHVGEHTLDNVLVASRREEKNTILYNFQYNKMKQIEPTDDVTYTNGGFVADIDIFCNAKIEDLKKKSNSFTQELIFLLEEQNRYYDLAKEELEKILPIAKETELLSVMSDEEKTKFYHEKKEYGFNWLRPQPKELCPNKYTEEFGYFWKKVHEYNDNRISWRNKGKSFQNFKIKFTIIKENPISAGSKITARWKLSCLDTLVIMY